MDDDEAAALFHEFDDAVAGWQMTGRAQTEHDVDRAAEFATRGRELQQQLVDAGVLTGLRHSWTVRLRVATYNLANYTAASAADRGEQRELIRALEPDILCVQELRHHTDDPRDPAPHALLDELAEQLGMDGRLAYARSGHHLGVLFRPEFELRNWSDYRHWPWHHGAGMATLDVGARQPLRVGAAHFSPFDPGQRAHEAQLLGALGPTEHEWVLLGADLNAPSTHAPEPYLAQEGGPHQLHQRIVSEIDAYDPDVAPVDRRAALLLDRHGLLDLADRGPTHPWPMTTGHHPDDPHGPRQPDCLRGSGDLLAHAGALYVHDTALARDASDHLPLSASLTLPWQPTPRLGRTPERAHDHSHE